MISYEELKQEVPIILDDQATLPVWLKGIFIESSTSDMILLNKSIESKRERKCVLAEELGHYHLTVGNIVDQSIIGNQQQELRARQWGYEKLVPLSAIVQAFHTRVKGRYEIAEYLDVTEDFLKASIDRYRNKYGIYTTWNNYIIYFDPLVVAEMYE
ncbi:ImmA/IrrE family metallo-endopeptidase [Paenibacillus farraposensis]|uniref:ImmA/IrrE family metallo-endopeptidase n=1 Tax=Paenibacillus farraposensis TaxID=2807095 RepID=A0ABW4DG95_9BACL|nr:ImmA/IrrE family metallo-endopeptidase [Paenibacillus farraposensis]MCC3380740.1 ImmA/IrrE family metallo-endopeptidase [Paenibacillus farraposensis]